MTLGEMRSGHAWVPNAQRCECGKRFKTSNLHNAHVIEVVRGRWTARTRGGPK